jgi:hypothetical protein
MDAKVEAAVDVQPKLSVRDLNFFYGGFRALKNTPRHSREEGDVVHRPVGMRQVDAAAYLQPDVRALP